MRYKPEHKEETHRRILELASREFRTHGFEGVGIAKLMGGLNLTHGGFYAYFSDKEDLVAESLALALDQSLETMLAGLEADGLTAMLDFYLSEAHRDHPDLGCPLPALAAEVARRSPSSQAAFTTKLTEIFDAIAEHMPGTTHSQKLANVSFMFSAMTGAVSLARAVSDPVLSKAILESTREQLVHLFGEKPSES
jgi:TetR/AcrR family transcriptional regulator, transcriptional repressor for nem operon